MQRLIMYFSEQLPQMGQRILAQVACSHDVWGLNKFLWVRSLHTRPISQFLHTAKLGHYIPWIYIIFYSNHILIGPTRPSIKTMLNFPAINVCFCLLSSSSIIRSN